MQCRQCPAELNRTDEGVSREVGLKEIKVPLVYLSLHQRESKSVKGFNIESYMLKVIQSAKNRVYLYERSGIKYVVIVKHRIIISK